MKLDRVDDLPPLLRGPARAVLDRAPRVRAVLRALRNDVATDLGPAVSAPPTAPVAAPETREYVPPGHYYSPIPPLSFVRRNEARLFGPPARAVTGVDLREEAQRALVESFLAFYAELPFPVLRTPPRRYWYENPAYSYSDAIMLHCMIRHARPRRIVEVGSGHSSCVTLDTNELFFGDAISCSFVEPYPELLRSLLRPGDEERIAVHPIPVQEAPLAIFDALEANDILFIDSTHVSRVGSDVNHLLFEVLPRLAPGVLVHFHDVFFPFEYPREWILEGRAWTEAYLVRAFLTGNAGWEVVLMNTFLEHFHRDWFEQNMPLCLRNPGGSLWIRRAAA